MRLATAVVVVGAVVVDVVLVDDVVVDVEEVVDVVDVVDVVVAPEDEKSQLPRPEQRSYPTRHGAPLLPDVMSRNVSVDP